MDDHKYCYRRERKNSNPSFSSTLLDSIYRSIDESQVGEEEEREQKELVLYKETCMRKKHHQSGIDNMANFQRACLIEKWMEKEVVIRRNSAPDFVMRKSRNDYDPADASSSSDSSWGAAGGFSSSEAESFYGVSSCYGLHHNKPKPIRTSVSNSSSQPAAKFSKKHEKKELKMYGVHDFQPKPKIQEEGFVKSKSRALKMYGDLKKVKQPISPGGRLASFLNSIFAAGNAKKPKISKSSNIGFYENGDAETSERNLKSANGSTCSSASSFSRSCLSKTPSSSRGKSSNGTKRSVRFYPVSVIVDEDCQPCGQKSLYDEKPIVDLDRVKNNIRSSCIVEELKFHGMEKNRRVEEAARDLIRNFQKKVESDQFDMRNARIKSQVFDHVDNEEEEENDDAASYASSDLFELDNLSAIGNMERYREELPVYETTHLDTNRAIANGLIL